MKRIVHISNSFQEASTLEVEQEISMSVEERQKAARALKRKFFGVKCPDVRSASLKK
jgi:adenylylsulfate kinase-like enzyme